MAIVWHERTHTIDVVYGDGNPDMLMGTQEMAARLAEAAGLDLIPTNPETILWTHGESLPG